MKKTTATKRARACKAAKVTPTTPAPFKPPSELDVINGVIKLVNYRREGPPAPAGMLATMDGTLFKELDVPALNRFVDSIPSDHEWNEERILPLVGMFRYLALLSQTARPGDVDNVAETIYSGLLHKLNEPTDAQLRAFTKKALSTISE